MSSDMDGLDCCLLYALQRLVSPELKREHEQLSVTESVYRGKDVCVWLPTGCGKSICYHMIPFVFESKLGHKLNRHNGKL